MVLPLQIVRCGLFSSENVFPILDMSFLFFYPLHMPSRPSRVATQFPAAPILVVLYAPSPRASTQVCVEWVFLPRGGPHPASIPMFGTQKP